MHAYRDVLLKTRRLRKQAQQEIVIHYASGARCHVRLERTNPEACSDCLQFSEMSLVGDDWMDEEVGRYNARGLRDHVRYDRKKRIWGTHEPAYARYSPHNRCSRLIEEV